MGRLPLLADGWSSTSRLPSMSNHPDGVRPNPTESAPRAKTHAPEGTENVATEQLLQRPERLAPGRRGTVATMPTYGGTVVYELHVPQESWLWHPAPRGSVADRTHI